MWGQNSAGPPLTKILDPPLGLSQGLQSAALRRPVFLDWRKGKNFCEPKLFWCGWVFSDSSAHFCFQEEQQSSGAPTYRKVQEIKRDVPLLEIPFPLQKLWRNQDGMFCLSCYSVRCVIMWGCLCCFSPYACSFLTAGTVDWSIVSGNSESWMSVTISISTAPSNLEKS